MSLSGIWDPAVRAYFKKHGGGSGGGSTVDDGFYLKWDGNTEGRDVIDTDLSFSFCKVSNAILNAEQINGAELLSVNGVESCIAVEIEGAVIAVGRGDPFVFSGLAGSYSVDFIGKQLDFICPSNGTYFLFVPMWGYTEYIRKEAPA